ncbi:hypothetical protein TSAR_008289 [Trichomalopsis sarcophagae]|uniref:BZIP domain-containing protein n=1 Tax=Trichomalopsis sarcophagae TaxID=543379 RepID=A0A232F613_9HYME|nr:hypothetical protein TSAR_008289 [Trichomalopsis sarcophagae]
MVRNPTMEPSFYEQEVIYGNGLNRIGAGPIGNEIGSMKRCNLSLDLNGARQGGPQSKRPRLGQLTPGITGITPLINSPDLMKLGLTTPDIERFLNADGMIPSVPTPVGGYFDSKIVTEDQEKYAQGFVDALNELQNSDSSQEPGSINGAIYTNLEPPGSVQSTESLLSQGMVQIKDEPQTVPSVSSSPPMSPIDMESQERIKLERKRQRNRVAASKCRRRKLERISRLEDRVKVLKNENSDLSQVINKLKESISRLKEQVIDHVNSGCQIGTMPQLF